MCVTSRSITQNFLILKLYIILLLRLNVRVKFKHSSHISLKVIQSFVCYLDSYITSRFLVALFI